jgi:O-antigen/teichoic acid export membrane protein
LRNSVYIMSSTVVASAVGYVYWLVAARTYKPTEVGLGAALISVTMLASLLANFGGGSVLVALLPKRRDELAWSRTVSSAVAMGLALSIVGGVVLVVVLPLASPHLAVVGRSAALALATVCGVSCWTLATLADLTFVAERAAAMMLLRTIVSSLAKLALLVLPLLVWHPRALGIVGSSVLASGLSAVGALWILVPRLKPGARPVLSGLLRSAWEMRGSMSGHHAINLGGLLPMYLLPVIVVTRLSVTANAYFYVSWMLGGLFFMVSPAVASALFAEGSHDAASIARATRSAARIISALLVGPMVAFLIGAHWVLSLFGPGYPSRGSALIMVLVVSAVPDAITNIAVSVFRVQGRLRLAAGLNIGMALIALGFSWLMLPRLGIVAVGWGWLLAQSLGSVAVAATGCLPALRSSWRDSRHWRPEAVER